MPQGLQTFDAAGNIVVDTSTRVLKNRVEIAFTANTTAEQTFALPPGTGFALVAAKPNGSASDARVIASERVGNDLKYRARVADGQSYTLNVVLF